MLKNYLTIALRRLVRRKSYSLMNIVGLGVGIAACTLIYSYICYERSYDAFNKNADSIYRLKNVRYYSSGTDSSAGCVALLGPTLKEDIPEVAGFARLRNIQALVSVHDQYFNENNIFWADSSFLTIFSFPLISGNAGSALAGPYRAVLARSTAQKYFGSNNAMGETILIGGTAFTITGIADNVPANSHVKFDILLSFTTQLTDGFCWGCNNNATYIQLTPGATPSMVEAKLALIVRRLHNRQIDGFDRAYFLQPLTDIHLHSHLRSEHEENGNEQTLYFLSLAAFLILLIAWVNYVNLSTARSIERAREVGLRKVVGARYWSLVPQFLIESFVINCIAVIMSFSIVVLTFPYWCTVIGMPDSVSLWNNMNIIMLWAVMILVIPLIAGLYPAYVLSSYAPVTLLRGGFKNSLRGTALRKGLVVFQFTISIILIVVVLVVNQQIAFMRNINLGFDIKQKVVVNAPFNMQNGRDCLSTYNTLRNELRSRSLIEDATFSSVVPGMENGDVSGGVRTGEQSIEKGKQVYFVYIAQNHLTFFHIDLVCGRNFLESEVKETQDHTRALLINESAARAFGFTSPEKAMGAFVYRDNERIGNIIGVIKDYHQQSLDKEIKPTVFECAERGNYVVFDLNAGDMSKTIEGIKDNFARLSPGNPFEYRFLDEFFDRQYRTNIKAAEIFEGFTLLSICISCLGLVGLSSLTITHKTKELGVRKVFGASVHSLLALLSREFLLWLLISNVIAWPIAYYLMQIWLQDFAYRIDIGLWVFVLSCGIALLVALATISLQAIKAATANPVDALRYE
jgi:putative ABC transport system permease protein